MYLYAIHLHHLKNATTNTSGSSQHVSYDRFFQQNRPGLLDIDVIGQGQGVRALLSDLRTGMAWGPLGPQKALPISAPKLGQSIKNEVVNIKSPTNLSFTLKNGRVNHPK